MYYYLAGKGKWDKGLTKVAGKVKGKYNQVTEVTEYIPLIFA